MADNKRPPKIKMTSPRGAFVYPKLNKPDLGSKEFPKDPPGEFSLKLRLIETSPAAQALIAKLKPYHEAAHRNGEAEYAKLDKQTRVKLDKQGGCKLNDLYTVIYDKETEEPTGEIEFKFSMKAGGVIKNGPKKGEKWISRPAVFDAKGRPIAMFAPKGDRAPLESAPQIWGGTNGIVSFEFDPDGYFVKGSGACGISLKLVGVQVIDLVSGGERNAKDLGFTAQDDGYEYDETAQAAGSADDEAEGSSEAGSEEANPDF